MAVCRYCGTPLSFTQRLFGDGLFCCFAHRRRFREETERAALEVLQRYRDTDPSTAPSHADPTPPAESELETPLGDWMAGAPVSLAGTAVGGSRRVEPSASEVSPFAAVPFPPKSAATRGPSTSRSWPPAETVPAVRGVLAQVSVLTARDCPLLRPSKPELAMSAEPGVIVAPEEFHDPRFRGAKRVARLSVAGGPCFVGGIESLPPRDVFKGAPPVRFKGASPLRRVETGVLAEAGTGAVLVPQEFETPAPVAVGVEASGGLCIVAGSGSIPARARFAGQSPFPLSGTGTATAPCGLTVPPPAVGSALAAPVLAARTIPSALREPSAAQEPRWILSRPRPLPPDGPPLVAISRSASTPLCLRPAPETEPDSVAVVSPVTAESACTLSVYLWNPGPTADVRRPAPLPNLAPPQATGLPFEERGPAAMPAPRRKIRSGPAAAASGEVTSPRFESKPASPALSPVRALPAGAGVGSEMEPLPLGLVWLATQLEIADWREVQEVEALPEVAEDEFSVTMKLARPKLIRETPALQSLSERLWRVYVPRFNSPTLRPRLSVGPRPAAALGY